MFGTLTVFLMKRLFCFSLILFDPPSFDKFNLPLALSSSLTATLCLNLKQMKRRRVIDEIVIGRIPNCLNIS